MKSKVLLIAYIALTLSVGARAQKSNEDYFEELNTAGYPVTQPLSFAVTKRKYALTGLYKSIDDKNALIHTAEINANKDGADIFFRVNRPCVPTGNVSRLQERVIIVSGQKVETYYTCGYGSSESQTNEVYVIKSTSGKEFARKVFSEMKYVFVYLNGLPVPFHTEGFSEAMAESSGKAL